MRFGMGMGKTSFLVFLCVCVCVTMHGCNKMPSMHEMNRRRRDSLSIGCYVFTADIKKLIVPLILTTFAYHSNLLSHVRPIFTQKSGKIRIYSRKRHIFH